jgi:hypothetical protein
VNSGKILFRHPFLCGSGSNSGPECGIRNIFDPAKILMYEFLFGSYLARRIQCIASTESYWGQCDSKTTKSSITAHQSLTSTTAYLPSLRTSHLSHSITEPQKLPSPCTTTSSRTTIAYLPSPHTSLLSLSNHCKQHEHRWISRW